MIGSSHFPKARPRVQRPAKKSPSSVWPRVLLVALGLWLLAVAGVATWLHRPMLAGLAPGAVADIRIEKGASARQVVQALRDIGVSAPEWWLLGWLRLSGQSRQIRAGAYELDATTTPSDLLGKWVRGEQAQRRLTLVEGWNLRQVLQALTSAEHLVDDLPPHRADPVALAAHLGLRHPHAEGRFFPDTYLYPKNSRASELLRQAADAMDRELARAWGARSPGLPMKHPDELLVLASLVEKETGAPADRPQIAGVFVNRLRIGMRLQTDPSVIYGLGERFDGNLRRRDLLADTPYNSYTRAGLPPTPIAMPGRDSLQAAAQPAATRALYFVARGDGSSHFSTSLEEHNQAVRRYILGR
jgi:UPF0755 protein